MLANMLKQIEAVRDDRRIRPMASAIPTPGPGTIEELREVQRIACALARAARSECDFYTDLITELEPP